MEFISMCIVLHCGWFNYNYPQDNDIYAIHNSYDGIYYIHTVGNNFVSNQECK